MELLQITDLNFIYPNQTAPAIADVDFSVREGEFVLLVGASGCGKSTLLRHLSPTLAPHGKKTGEILFDGVPMEKLDARVGAESIGFVGQDPENGIVTDTVSGELAFAAESLGWNSDKIRRRVAETAAYYGIGPWFGSKTSALSGGQKQILNLAAATVLSPRLLLLDEPTAQLDPIAAAELIATLGRLNRDLGVAVVIAEHRLEELLPMADKVVLLEEGKIAFSGSPAELSDYCAAHPGCAVAQGLPASVRLRARLGGTGSPMTVREGREWLKMLLSDTNPPHLRKIEENNDKNPKTRSTQTAIELRDAWFRYEKNAPDVLAGMSLKVAPGEHFCLLGGNGAGKSTALSVLAGLERPYRGQVLVGGRRADKLGAALYRGNLAYLPQDPKTLFVDDVLADDLCAVCRAAGLPADEARTRARESAERFGVSHLLDRHPLDLSGGELQRAAMAKLMLCEPKILLLDEPTKGIDAPGRETLGALLRDATAAGMTVVTVTHDVEFAAAYADRCGLMFAGSLACEGAVRDFFAGNAFYTTAAARIASGILDGVLLCEDVVR